jgi:hypothetical protein
MDLKQKMINMYGDIDLHFDSFSFGVFHFKGEGDGVVVSAEKGGDDSIFDFGFQKNSRFNLRRACEIHDLFDSFSIEDKKIRDVIFTFKKSTNK